MKKFNGQTILCAVLLLLLAAFLAAAPSQAAVLADLTDAELANVTGQSGITIWTNGAARVTVDVAGFTDSLLLHSLELQNIVVGGSSLSSSNNGGYFSWSTPIDFGSNPTLPPPDPAALLASAFKLNTIDVATILVPDVNGVLPGGSGYITTYQTLVVSQDSTHVSPRWYSVGYWDPAHAGEPDGGLVGGLVFCNNYHLCSDNYPLGTLNLDALSVGPSLQRYGAHADGTMGIDFDYSTSVYAQALRYTYNNTLQALAMTGIHLAGSATTGDPRYPDGGPEPSPGPYTYQPWGFSGTFKIGDIADGPAQIDIGTSVSSGTTMLQLKLPMEGSIRVEDVIFGTDVGGNPVHFGPLALDGIEVHRLAIQLHP